MSMPIRTLLAAALLAFATAGLPGAAGAEEEAANPECLTATDLMTEEAWMAKRAELKAIEDPAERKAAKKAWTEELDAMAAEKGLPLCKKLEALEAKKKGMAP